jgi:hypothetical protein
MVAIGNECKVFGLPHLLLHAASRIVLNPDELVAVELYVVD